MAMELPVIVTNHSGPSAYLTRKNSFPLDPGPAEAEGGFADPSVADIRRQMRRVFSSPIEANQRGKQV